MDGLVISKAMVLRRAFYAVVFVILLCTLAIGDSEGNKKTLETFLKNGDGCVTQEMDEHMVWDIKLNLKSFFILLRHCYVFFRD